MYILVDCSMKRFHMIEQYGNDGTKLNSRDKIKYILVNYSMKILNSDNNGIIILRRDFPAYNDISDSFLCAGVC